jgi:hypothetical protein
MGERPTLPSARKWGGVRGYCYVIRKFRGDTFDFEGSRYCFIEENNRTYIYRINAHLQKH